LSFAICERTAARIFEQILDRVGQRRKSVALDQVEQPPRADVAGGDLRVHVADDEIRDADVVGDHPPQRLVALALVVDLERAESQPLGIRVRADHDADAARLARADVEVVRRRHREANQRAVVEDRHAETDVGAVRGAVVRVVVDDHVARLEGVAARLERADDAAHVAGDRPGLQRRALRAFAELPPTRVADRGAEVIGLADDARIRHPHELVAHLDRDVLERALDDARGDGVDALLGRGRVDDGLADTHAGGPLERMQVVAAHRLLQAGARGNRE
jgi:hypothetical protein